MANLPNVQKILERQARSWEMRQQIADEAGDAARQALAHLQEGPWLTISRQLGAGGGQIARDVGRDLDWQVYDREVLATIAQHTHTREQVLSELDGAAVAPFKEFISRLLVRDDPSQLGYLQELTHVVWGLARKGQAIILGRAANWYLDDRFGLRIRVVAPIEDRVRNVADSTGCSETEAHKLVLAHDGKRRGFVEQYFGRDINDPLGYDLLISTGALERDTAAHIVVEALRRKLLAQP